MNLVLDEAVEVKLAKPRKDMKEEQRVKRRTELGRILLKGDNITLISSVSSGAEQ